MCAYTDNIGIDVTHTYIFHFANFLFPSDHRTLFTELYFVRLKFLRAWNKRSNYVPSNGTPGSFRCTQSIYSNSYSYPFYLRSNFNFYIIPKHFQIQLDRYLIYLSFSYYVDFKLTILPMWKLLKSKSALKTLI